MSKFSYEGRNRYKDFLKFNINHFLNSSKRFCKTKLIERHFLTMQKSFSSTLLRSRHSHAYKREREGESDVVLQNNHSIFFKCINFWLFFIDLQCRVCKYLLLEKQTCISSFSSSLSLSFLGITFN